MPRIHRTDLDFLVKFALAAKKAGADRLRYCDTIGILEPFKTYEIIASLIDKTGMDIEMHTHNDFEWLLPTPWPEHEPVRGLSVLP